jgi:hypothetical protein
VRGGQGSGNEAAGGDRPRMPHLDDAKNGIAGGMMPAKTDEG